MAVYGLRLIACLQIAYYCAYGIYFNLSFEFEGDPEAKSKLLTTDALPNTTAKNEYSLTLHTAKEATMKTTQSTTGSAASTPTVTSLPNDVNTAMTLSTPTSQSPSITRGTISSSSVSSTASSSTSTQSQTTLRTTLKTQTTLSSTTTLSPTTLPSTTTQPPKTAIASNLTKQSDTTTFSTTTQLQTTASNPTTQSPTTISSTTTQSSTSTSSPTPQSHTTKSSTTIQSASTTFSSITQPPTTASSLTTQSHTTTSSTTTQSLTTSSTTTQSQTRASTTSTQHLTINVTRRMMSFQISLKVDEKQDFLNAKVVDDSNKILFKMYQRQLGSNFRKLQMKSVRFSPLVVDYDIFVKNSPSTFVNVVNLMKNISAGKTNVTYNGKDVRVLFVSYTDSTNNQVLINDKTDPKAVIESSFVCILDESCERTSTTSNADKDDIPTCIIISIAVVTALIVTCAFTITIASMICARKIIPKDRRQYTLVPSQPKVPV